MKILLPTNVVVNSRSLLVLACALLLAPANAVPVHAGQNKEDGKQEEEEEGDVLDDELSNLQESDFPDLVSADDEGALIDEFAFLEEAATVESAARHKQEIGMSPSAITVITREDIATSGARTVPDLLRMVPGMDVVVTSPMYLSVNSRLYWTTEGQYYLVLVDGREVNVELLGFPPWSVQPFFLEDIERIEVIRGPGSSLYGANAMAGVISISTRAVAENPTGWAKVEGGEVASVVTGGHVSTRFGDWGVSLGGGVELAGSFADFRTRALRGWKLRSVIEYEIDPQTRLLLDAGLAQGVGPFSTSAGKVQSDFAVRTVRLALDAENVSGQLYWQQTPNIGTIQVPLEYGGIRLATFAPFAIYGHTFDGQAQWILPTIWDPLLVIAGGGGRLSWLKCDNCLDGDSYTDRTSPDYHLPGVDHIEWRAGAFVHAELTPVDWLTVTGGVRFDYNSATDAFVSPRLAAVFRPAEGHFLRAGATRAFRKPSFMEQGAHVMVEFPQGSPIQGPARDEFQEFMSRVLGNSDLSNEELTSLELGYMGKFLDRRLKVSVDLYANFLRNTVELESQVVSGEQGLPDLQRSFFRFANVGPELDIYGAELSIRYSPSESLSFLASWSPRAIFDGEGAAYPETPKNLLTLGGRFRTGSGMLGSLYLFTRSELWDRSVENPDGLLMPVLSKHLDHVGLIVARLGYQARLSDLVEIETGMKLFLPLSPFSGSFFRYREEGGGTTGAGLDYGGEPLGRVLSLYLQGRL